jgi:hypothetical protein
MEGRVEFTRRGGPDRGRRFILPVLSQARNFTLILQLREQLADIFCLSGQT